MDSNILYKRVIICQYNIYSRVATGIHLVICENESLNEYIWRSHLAGDFWRPNERAANIFRDANFPSIDHLCGISSQWLPLSDFQLLSPTSFPTSPFLAGRGSHQFLLSYSVHHRNRRHCSPKPNRVSNVCPECRCRIFFALTMSCFDCVGSLLIHREARVVQEAHYQSSGPYCLVWIVSCYVHCYHQSILDGLQKDQCMHSQPNAHELCIKLESPTGYNVRHPSHKYLHQIKSLNS